jgi:hypothetical protein
MPPPNSHHNEDALSLDEHASVEAARSAYMALRKTFETWVTVGRGLQTLWLKAERIGGRQTFGRLREKENLGERQLQKATVTRLLQIIERLPEVELWRRDLTQKQQFEWASPSAVFKHCPVFAKPKNGAVKPRKTTAKETTGRLAELQARNAELEEELAGARGDGGALHELKRKNLAQESEIEDLKAARELVPPQTPGACSFCGKSAEEVTDLLTSSHDTARICNECVILCVETLRMQAAERIKGLTAKVSKSGKGRKPRAAA